MTDTFTYDLIILGGGAGAFAALTEADRRDLRTAMVNTGLPLGGTCVNVGCVPSKHLLEVGKTAFEPVRTPFEAIRYANGQPSINWEDAIDETDDLVATLRERNYIDVAERFKADVFEGFGRFVDDTTIEIMNGEDAGMEITGRKALIATGSSPHIAPIDGIEEVPYETSETILERRDQPARVVIVGGGYVAMEWGQILHHLGTDVTILQRSNQVLSGMEGQLGRELMRCFEDEGIEIVTGVEVERVVERRRDGASSERNITVTANIDGDSLHFTGSDLLMATGVRANTEGIGLESISVETTDTGAVVVDQYLRTANPDVYAAGDVTGEPMLETVAAKEGNHAVRNAFGGDGVTIDYHAIPSVIFTSPEVAAVGTTEIKYMEDHGTCACRTVDIDNLPKARAVKDPRGLLKVVKHHETDEIVGVHIVSPRAADIITEATLAVKFGLTIDDIIDTVHPFPTFSEAFKQACQAFRRDVSKMTCCVE